MFKIPTKLESFKIAFLANKPEIDEMSRSRSPDIFEKNTNYGTYPLTVSPKNEKCWKSLRRKFNLL